MTLDREKGITAIIKLQALAGIDESYEQAEVGWDRMSDAEKQHTMNAFAFFVEPDSSP